MLYAAETWALMERLEGLVASCDHRIVRYMSRVKWQDGLLVKRSQEDVGQRT